MDVGGRAVAYLHDGFVDDAELGGAASALLGVVRALADNLGLGLAHETRNDHAIVKSFLLALHLAALCLHRKLTIVGAHLPHRRMLQLLR